ncbi:MAG: hypothetical protein IJU75_06210 [Clostridia bacterium]|nr:hypothetical protein [Clostridia bacterium]
MMKRANKLIAVLVAAMIAFSVFPLMGSAAGLTVVYVSEGGDGNGATPESPVGTLADAYDKLDLEKDCVIVICGPVFIWDTWDYGTNYSGSVTFTSVYGGTDYRETAGASLKTMYKNFALRGDTRFEYITIECVSNNGIHFDCGFNPITFGYGVENVGSGLTGEADSRSIFIVGGYQSGYGDFSGATDKNVSINIFSGSYYCISTWSRGMPGETYSGDANIVIGGDASVGLLSCTGMKSADLEVGNVNITVEGNATLSALYGTINTVTEVKSLNVNWFGGNIISAYDLLKDENVAHFAGGRNLTVSPAAKDAPSFGDVSAWFDSVSTADAPETHVPPEIPEYQNPIQIDDTDGDDPSAESSQGGSVITDDSGKETSSTDVPAETTEKTLPGSAAASQTGEKQPEETTKTNNSGEEKPSSLPIIIASVAAVVVAAAVIVIIVLGKKKK